MKLNEKINQDFVFAMKSKDEITLSTLRMLKSAIKNREIEIGQELKDGEIGEVARKSVKQRKDSMNEYQKGSRADLVAKEQKEIKILEKYLPAQLSEEKILSIIDKTIKSTGASDPQDMGKVMGQIMPKFKGKADGALVSKLVKEKLQG